MKYIYIYAHMPPLTFCQVGNFGSQALSTVKHNCHVSTFLPAPFVTIILMLEKLAKDNLQLKRDGLII